MAKRKNIRKKRKRNQRARKPPMTREKIAEVRTLLERIQTHATRAVDLSKRMSTADLDDSNDLFWALSKYAENVQESIVRLDDINNDIYPSLIELDKDTWRGLKGMRSRLAHAFWNIDPSILWSTVTTDFSELLALLSTMIVLDKPVHDYEDFDVVVGTEHLLGLPDVTAGSVIKAGNTIVVLTFTYSGRVRVFRIGHEGTTKLSISANFDGLVSVYGR